MKALAAMVLLGCAACAGSTPIERLIEGTAVAPPEIAADVLVRVVEKRLVREPKAAKGLLEQAWHLAGQARLPMPRRTLPLVVRPGGPVAGGMPGNARLDTLTLRARVLKQLHELDRAEALEWLRGMAAPVPEAVECGSAWVWDPGPWFDVVEALGGTLEDRLQAVQAVTHPGQLAPALELVLGYQGAGEDRAMLAGRWAGALAAVRGDSVAFEGTRELPVPMAVVAEKLRSEGQSAAFLADAWRVYLLTHWRGEVCEEYATAANRQTWRLRTESAYNKRLREAAASDAPEIDFEEEARPVRIIPYEPRRDEEMRTRFEEWGALVGSVARVVPALGQEASPGEVRRAVLDLLEQFEAWSEPVEGVSEEQWLQLRLTSVTPLLMQVDGETRRDVLRWRLRLLRDSELQRTAPEAWLVAWRQVLPAAPAELVREAGSPLMDLMLLAHEILGWQ
jgi:hypothetical protein